MLGRVCVWDCLCNAAKWKCFCVCECVLHKIMCMKFLHDAWHKGKGKKKEIEWQKGRSMVPNTWEYTEICKAWAHWWWRCLTCTCFEFFEKISIMLFFPKSSNSMATSPLWDSPWSYCWLENQASQQCWGCLQRRRSRLSPAWCSPPGCSPWWSGCRPQRSSPTQQSTGKGHAIYSHQRQR